MDNLNIFSLVYHVDLDLIEENREKILSDFVFVLEEYPLYSYTKDLWFENPTFDEDYTFYMQTLLPVSHLLAVYQKTDDDLFIEKAMTLFYCWYEENFKTNRYKKDHGLVVGLRLLVVCDLLTTGKKIDFCMVEDTFENVLLSHSEILEYNKQYKQNSDGLKQDIALFVSSVVLYHYYNNPNFLNLRMFVKERLLKNLNLLIEEDGSFKEHTLEGALEVYLYLYTLYPFVLKHGESPDLTELMKHKIDNLLIFIYAMLEPGGYLPNIGLGSYKKINMKQFEGNKHPLIDHIKYLCTNGLEGKKLLYHNVYFPNSQYFISVNHKEVNPTFMKLFIYNHINPNLKHYDHLSFTFYYKYTPMLIDSGYYENKDHLSYPFINSLYGHNSIVVDRHDYINDKNTINKSGITNIAIDNQITFVSIVSCLYEGVLLRRNFFFIKDYYLILIDEFDSLENHQYEMTFNINPQLMLKMNDLVYTGYLEGEKCLSLGNLYSTSPCQTTYVYGDQKGNIGNMSIDGKILIPSHHIVYKMKASQAINMTLITFNSELHVSYQILDHQIHFKIGEDVYTIIRNKFYRYLEKNKRLVHDEKTTNKALLNTIHDFYRYKK